MEQYDPDNQFDFVQASDGSDRTDYPESLGLGNEQFFVMPSQDKLRSLGGTALTGEGDQ